MKRKISLFLALSIFAFGCSKDKKVECPIYEDIVGPIPSFRFNIVDKASGQNYDTSQLKCFVKQDSVGSIIIRKYPIFIDSVKHCLYSYPYYDTIFIQITDLSADTLLIKSSKSIPDGPCNFTYFIDSVQFDRQIYTANDKQILNLKK